MTKHSGYTKGKMGGGSAENGSPEMLMKAL